MCCGLTIIDGLLFWFRVLIWCGRETLLTCTLLHSLWAYNRRWSVVVVPSSYLIWSRGCLLHCGAYAISKTPPICTVPRQAFHLSICVTVVLGIVSYGTHPSTPHVTRARRPPSSIGIQNKKIHTDVNYINFLLTSNVLSLKENLKLRLCPIDLTITRSIRQSLA